MKKLLLPLSFVALTLSACTKNTTNNNYVAMSPAFIVEGIHDISMENGGSSSELDISVQYQDSVQEVVTLSLSSLPAGITMDTTWITSGIPTFGTDILLYDTTANGATPGTYPITLTATGATSGKKTYSFNLKIVAQPLCTQYFVGKYADCNNFCLSNTYADSVYNDATITDKIWFTNFDNTGSKAYATYNCTSGVLTMPAQTIGGVVYSGSGWASGNATTREIEIEYTTGSTSCEVEMNN